MHFLMVGLTALTFVGGAWAQEDETTTDEPVVEAPAFVDEDGDGINDVAMQRHRRGALGQEIRNSFMATKRGQLQALTTQLTEEQQTELQEMVAALREEGKTREEVHAAVGTKLQEFGLELPEDWSQTPQEYAEQFRLSEEQRSEVHALVESMRTEGKTRDEIRAAVAAKYEEWGKELPPGQINRRGPRGPRSGEIAPAAETTE